MKRLRASSLAAGDRDWCWLRDLRSGMSAAVIARRAGCTPKTIRTGIARARAAERQLRLLLAATPRTE